MKIFQIFALGIALTSSAAFIQAEEGQNIVTEVDRVMVVWSPNGNALGRLHLFPCQTCEARVVTFDTTTTLQVAGNPRPIEDLKLKVDWAGFVTTNTAAPERALALELQ